MKFNFKFVIILAVLISSACSQIPDYNAEAENKPAPQVAFVNLTNTQLITAPVVINGRSTDTKGISSVKIIIDGTEYNATQNPDWNTWTFNLGALGTGEHNISAVAVNSDGIEGRTSLMFYYGDGIDLQAVKVDVTGTTVNRQTLILSGTVKVDVRNNSPYSVTNSYRVAAFEDTNYNKIYDPAVDRILGYADVGAGHSASSTRTVDIDVNLPVLFADNLIYGFVDLNESIMESNELNNLLNNMAGVEYHPPVGSFNPVVEWHWSGSTINPTSNQVICSPIVAPLIDNNGDGKIDGNDIPYVIFNSYVGTTYVENGTLRAIKGDGTGELFSVIQYDTNPISNPAVGDIDNDGKPEILVLDESHKLMAINNDGSHKWTSTYALPFVTLNSAWRSVTISDLDEDGTPEIIVGDYVFNNDGSLRWSGANADSMGNMSSCIAKLVSGERPYLVSGNTAYRFDGSIYWTKNTIYNGFTAVGDIDMDGFPDIVVVYSGNAWALKADGSIIWGPIILPSNGGGAPTIADVNNDNKPEIGIACAFKYVVLKNNGDILWSKTTSDQSSNITGSSVFDFEGDGNTELIYADEEFLRIYNGSDGTELFKTSVGSGTGLEIPIIVDVDNDNKSEIVVVSNDLRHMMNPTYPAALNGIVVFGDANDTWVNTRKIWNQHSYHITNVNDNASIPQYETNNWSIYNNYRQNQLLNPFEVFDISSSYLRVNTSSFPGSVSITARIGNSGALAIGNSFFVAFYDGDPGAGGVLIGTREIISRVEPGTYVDVNFVWNTPGVGSHSIYVKADDDGAGHSRIREINELNNTIFDNFNW